MSKARGIDVSSYQGPQDWSALHAQGITFAFVKASEGEHTHDPRFAEHIKGAARAGMVVGAYHFFWPNLPVDQQVSNYVSAVKDFAHMPDGRTLRPGFVHWLDLEPYSDGRNYHGRTAAEIRAAADAWCKAVSARFPGQRVGIYAGAGEFTAGHVPAGWPVWFPAYPNGVRDWTAAERHPWPKGNGVLFWQWSGSPQDRSLSSMTPDELQVWAHAPAKPPAPKPPTTSKPPARPRVWVVRSGQTLGAIAAALGCSLASIVAYNHIHNPDLIYPGERITAPPAAPAKPTSKPKPKPTSKPTSKPTPKESHKCS